MPRWYEMVWKGAYLVPKGQLPYWFHMDNDDDDDKEFQGHAEDWVTINADGDYAVIDPETIQKN